jgi:hypothetical protein
MIPLQPVKVSSDRNFVWRPGRIFIPISEFSGIIGAAGVSAGVGVGAPVQQEISTFGLVGLLVDTAGDEVNHLMQLPYDLDPRYNIYTRVHFTTGSATAADTIEWLVRYLAITPNVTTLVDPATAEDTDIASMTVTGTAYSYQVSSWGVIKGGTLPKTTEAIAWEVELQAFAAGLTEDKFVLGLEVQYTPRRFYYGDGMGHEAKRPTYMLSDVYPN